MTILRNILAAIGMALLVLGAMVLEVATRRD